MKKNHLKLKIFHQNYFKSMNIKIKQTIDNIQVL